MANFKRYSMEIKHSNNFHQVDESTFKSYGNQDNAQLKSELSVEQSRAIFTHLGIPLVSQSATLQNKWMNRNRIYISQWPENKYPYWVHTTPVYTGG